jgi:hypothetical protein
MTADAQARTCPSCGCPAERPGDHHVVLASFLNPDFLQGDTRRPVRCIDCLQTCGYLPPEPPEDD